MKHKKKPTEETPAPAEQSALIPMPTSPVVEMDEKTKAHFIAVADYGQQIGKAYLAVGEKYLELCLYIRKNEVVPTLVRTALEPFFPKQRITEILTVSNSSNELWSEFEARRLAFRRVLELSRGTLQLLLETPEGQEPPAWVGEASETGNGEAEEARPKASNEVRLMAAVRTVAKLGLECGLQGKTFQMENGYCVKVWRKKASSKERKRGVSAVRSAK